MDFFIKDSTIHFFNIPYYKIQTMLTGGPGWLQIGQIAATLWYNILYMNASGE
jgi:hypothetical protein